MASLLFWFNALGWHCRVDGWILFSHLLCPPNSQKETGGTATITCSELLIITHSICTLKTLDRLRIQSNQFTATGRPIESHRTVFIVGRATDTGRLMSEMREPMSE